MTDPTTPTTPTTPTARLTASRVRAGGGGGGGRGGAGEPSSAAVGARAALCTAAGAVTALAVLNTAPALCALAPLRNRFMPGLAGQDSPRHVALTFDDGPDPRSTPRFLRLLERAGVRATFFLLGTMLVRSPGLAREIAAAGHEIGVHGWFHRRAVLRGPRSVAADLARVHDLAAHALGTPPALFRPPYGVFSASAHLACRALGMRPVLWTSWGVDWRSGATPRSVHDTVTRSLRGGGTILLHDSDCTSAPDSWRATLGALPRILDTCAERGWTVGPLRDHGLPDFYRS